MTESAELLYAALKRATDYLGDLNVARYRTGSPDQELNSLVGDCWDVLRKSKEEVVEASKEPLPERDGWGPKIPGTTQIRPGVWVSDESSSIFWGTKEG